MSLFNDNLKKITLKEILSLIIILFLILLIINNYNMVYIQIVWIYLFVIFYFIYKLRHEIPTVKDDIIQVFQPHLLKIIFLTVVLNIFLSYGMLYLSNFVLNVASANFTIFQSSILTGSLFATVIIAPISEELIFRGVFLNRLQYIVPPLFSVLISSLLFASLHSFGVIFSAFIFAICLSLLYLKTDNIFVPIFAHLLNNLFAEMIVILDSNSILFTNNLVVMVMSVLAVISFILIMISIIPELKNIK